MPSRPETPPLRCVIFGATGGIGRALVQALAARRDVACVYAGGRRAPAGVAGTAAPIRPFAFDLEDEPSIAAAAAFMAADGPLDLVIIATGRLTRADGTGPEKSWRGLDGAGLHELFAINTVGPALVAKHLLPLLRRPGPSRFAVLSARVGSIGDNRLGGWHGYRAAKAALNMLVRCFAIELARSHPQAAVVALHPGTVATDLSAPFASARGAGAFTPQQAAMQLLAVLDQITPENSGTILAWDGSTVPF